MNGIPKSWAWVFGLAAVGAALYTASDSQAGEGTIRSAQTQSREPWAIAQCDRLVGHRASAVFNTSTWSYGGWPLWRVTCLFKDKNGPTKAS